MNSPSIHIQFFGSALCPRCRHARRLLSRLGQQRPHLKVTMVDVLRHPRTAWLNKVRMIPTLISDDGRRLSGIVLTEKSITAFIDAP